MSVFVDTGVFYAHHDDDVNRHTVGTEALNTVLSSAEFGHVMTSDYVYDETVTLTQRRTGDIDAGLEVGRRICGAGYPPPSNYSTRLRRSSIVPCPSTGRTPTTSSVSRTR